MGIWVLHNSIKKGSELLVSYGKGFWSARGLLKQSEFNVEQMENLLGSETLENGTNQNNEQNFEIKD